MKRHFSSNLHYFSGKKNHFVHNTSCSSIKQDFFSLFSFTHPSTLQFVAYFSHSFFPVSIAVGYIIRRNQWRMSSAGKWEAESHLPMDRASDTTTRVAAFASFQLLCQKINPWLQQNLDTFSHLQRGPLIIHDLSSFSKLVYSEAKHPTKCSLLNLPPLFYRSSCEVKISHSRYFSWPNLRGGLVINNSEGGGCFAVWDSVLCRVRRVKSANTVIA